MNKFYPQIGTDHVHPEWASAKVLTEPAMCPTRHMPIVNGKVVIYNNIHHDALGEFDTYDAALAAIREKLNTFDVYEDEFGELVCDSKVIYVDADEWLYDVRDELVERIRLGESLEVIAEELADDAWDRGNYPGEKHIVIDWLDGYIEGLVDDDND